MPRMIVSVSDKSVFMWMRPHTHNYETIAYPKNEMKVMKLEIRH